MSRLEHAPLLLCAREVNGDHCTSGIALGFQPDAFSTDNWYLFLEPRFGSKSWRGPCGMPEILRRLLGDLDCRKRTKLRLAEKFVFIRFGCNVATIVDYEDATV
jgi:hypothetical protein